MKFTYSLMVVTLTAAASVGMATAQHMHDKVAAADANSGHQMINSELMHKCMMQDQMMEKAAKIKPSRTQMMKMMPRGSMHSEEKSTEEESGQTAMWNAVRCVMDGASSDPFLSAVIKLFALPIVKTDPGLSSEQITNLISMQQRVLDYYDKATMLISQKQDAINAFESDGESSRAEIDETTGEIDKLRKRQQSFITEMSRTMTTVLTDDQIESFEAYSIGDIHHFMTAEMSAEEMTLFMRIVHCDLMSADMMHGEGMEMMQGEGMEMMQDCPMQATMGHESMDGEPESEDAR